MSDWCCSLPFSELADIFRIVATISVGVLICVISMNKHKNVESLLYYDDKKDVHAIHRGGKAHQL